MIQNDQEMIEKDQEMIENDQKSHGALIMGPKGTGSQTSFPSGRMNAIKEYESNTVSEDIYKQRPLLLQTHKPDNVAKCRTEPWGLALAPLPVMALQKQHTPWRQD